MRGARSIDATWSSTNPCINPIPLPSLDPPTARKTRQPIVEHDTPLPHPTSTGTLPMCPRPAVHLEPLRISGHARPGADKRFPRRPYTASLGTGRTIRNADHTLKARWTKRFSALPADARAALRDALLDLRAESRENAELSWRRHKAPQAAYWKALSVYAGHLARALRPPS